MLVARLDAAADRDAALDARRLAFLSDELRALRGAGAAGADGESLVTKSTTAGAKTAAGAGRQAAFEAHCVRACALLRAQARRGAQAREAADAGVRARVAARSTELQDIAGKLERDGKGVVNNAATASAAAQSRDVIDG